MARWDSKALAAWLATGLLALAPVLGCAGALPAEDEELKIKKAGSHFNLAADHAENGRLELALRDLLADMEKWEATMRRFYQLLRHLVLAHELCWSDGWRLEPHLLAVVNALNVSRDGNPHAVEFEAFRSALRLPPKRTHLLTWQELLTRAEATFDPGVRPLLDHARRLRHLRPTEDQAG